MLGHGVETAAGGVAAIVGVLREGYDILHIVSIYVGQAYLSV